MGLEAAVSISLVNFTLVFQLILILSYLKQLLLHNTHIRRTVILRVDGYELFFQLANFLNTNGVSRVLLCYLFRDDISVEDLRHGGLGAAGLPLGRELSLNTLVNSLANLFILKVFLI